MQWGGLVLGVVLLAGYALPLFAPPETVLSPNTAGAWWIQRVFPGVPGVWAAVRLACLFVGAVLVGRAAPLRLPEVVAPDAPAHAARSRGEWAVLAAALLCAAAAVFAHRFTRPMQIGFIAMLCAPAVGAACTTRDSRRTRKWSIPVSAAGVVLTWSVWRLFDGLGSARRADPVDTLMSLNEVGLASDPSVNLLTEGSHLGVSSLHLTFHAAPLFTYFPEALSLEALQLLNVVWFAAAALLLAALLARIDYGSYAPAGVAMLLFSPFALLAPLVATPLYLGVLQSAASLFLLAVVHERRSAAALLAFAALAGIGISHPATAPTALALLAVAGFIVQRCRFSAPVISAAALVLFAAAYPGMPSIETLRDMTQTFGSGTIAWLQLEPILLGQATPEGVAQALEAGRPGPVDALVGALLSPFAIPRTALRLWGDALYEPLTSALAAVALVVCARQRSSRSLFLPALLLVALAAGFVSSYDRPSLTRTMSAPVPIALLGVYGLAAFSGSLDQRRRSLLVATTTVAIAASGSFLFDRVYPSVLPTSANRLAIEAFGGSADRQTWLLTHAKYDWLRTELIAAEVPEVPLDVFGILSTGSIEHLLARPVERFAWSPALEADFSVRRELCRLRPDAVLFDVVDQSGLSRVHIATLGRPGWTPAVRERSGRRRRVGARVDAGYCWTGRIEVRAPWQLACKSTGAR